MNINRVLQRDNKMVKIEGKKKIGAIHIHIVNMHGEKGEREIREGNIYYHNQI